MPIPLGVVIAGFPSRGRSMNQITLRYFLSVTAILAVCCSILSATGLDLIAGSGWLAFASLMISLPLFVNLLAVAFRLGLVPRSALSTIVPAVITTAMWQYQVQSGDYPITIGPDIVFVASLLQFMIGTAIIEATACAVSRYTAAAPPDPPKLDGGT